MRLFEELDYVLIRTFIKVEVSEFHDSQTFPESLTTKPEAEGEFPFRNLFTSRWNGN